MFGNRVPFVLNIGGASSGSAGYWTAGDQTLPGGIKTFVGPEWVLSTTAPLQTMVATSTNINTIKGSSVTDTGTNPITAFTAIIAGPATPTTRPPFAWFNNTNQVLTMLTTNSGVNGALSWGTQTGAAPAFTTRSAGTRLVLSDVISASDVDVAIGQTGGTTLWLSVPRATSSYQTRFYGGTSLIAQLRGDGVLTLGSGGPNTRSSQKLDAQSSAAPGGIGMSTWSTTASEAALLDWNRSKSATIGTHTIVASGDALGSGTFRGSDGTAFRDAAAITCHVDGTPGASDMPGRLGFWTTPDGSATLAERMRIDNAGNIFQQTAGTYWQPSGATGVKWLSGSGSPESAVTAAVGSLYTRTDGGAGTTLYVKESGAGNTGWVAK